MLKSGRVAVLESWTAHSLSQAVAARAGDSRRAVRRGADFRCRFRFDRTESEGRLIDLCVHGAFIESDEVPAESCRVQLTLELNSEYEFSVEGSVVHKGRYLTDARNFLGFGIQFKVLSLQARHAIEDLIRRSTAAPGTKRVLEG